MKIEEFENNYKIAKESRKQKRRNPKISKK